MLYEVITLKDRHAVTEQWFGIHLPGKPDPDLSVIENEQIQILTQARHSRKMRVGALKGNHFQLLLRDLNASDALEARLQAIAAQGVPNYFGSQRFGRQGNNLEGAQSIRITSYNVCYTKLLRTFGISVDVLAISSIGVSPA